MSDRRSSLSRPQAPGASGYVVHRDAAPERPSGRKLTVIYYLNPQWTGGGELTLWPPGDAPPVNIAPLDDRMVIFRSSLEHRVLPNGHETRLAVTTWFYNRLELAMELYAEKKRPLLEEDDDDDDDTVDAPE